jgi:plasmid stabilization system protein ParE
MSRQVFRRARAIEDLSSQYAYYLINASQEVADRYLHSAEDTLELLLTHDKLGAPRNFLNPQLSGVRMMRVRDFDHEWLIYRPREEGIELIRVLRDEQNMLNILNDEI